MDGQEIKKKIKTVESYTKNSKGEAIREISSTKVMSMLCLIFFFLSMGCIFSMMLFGSFVPDDNATYLIICTEFLLLIAAFVPKYLTKILELKRIFQITKRKNRKEDDYSGNAPAY